MRLCRALFLPLLTCLLLISQFAVSQDPLHSIYLDDLDRKAAPCDDFYEFANGTWRANNPIPASMSRWSRRWQAGESSKDKLHEILEAAAADKSAPKGSTEQIIGDYYGACMDESRVNARGVEPLKPWFAKIDGARDITALQEVMAELHDIIVNTPFSMGSQQDPHKPSWVLADFGASGLSLPDRDYYLKPEPRFKEAREKYIAHVTTMLKLAGWDAKSSAAAAQTNAGLQKWVFNGTSWNLAYTLTSGLNLGVPYTVAGYPAGDNAATGLPWAPATDGLRNITGRVNADGSVTIWAITSTVSGDGDQGADPNQLVSITDNPAATSPAAGEAFSVVRSAGFGEVLRGVSFTPGS